MKRIVMSIRTLGLMACLAASVVLAAEDGPTDEQAPAKNHIRALWIGASSTNSKLLRCADALVSSHKGYEMTSSRIGINSKDPKGRTLTQRIRDGNHNYFVIQVFRGLIENSPTDTYARRYLSYMCRSAQNAGATPVLFEHYFRTPKKIDAHQARLSRLCREAAAQYGALYAANGTAWQVISGNEEKGVKYLLNLEMRDGGHAGRFGNYLFACGIYAAITGESPVKNPVRWISSTRPKVVDGVVQEQKARKKPVGERYVFTVPEADAKYLEEAAWEQYQKALKTIEGMRKKL
jgi:hypothetical protein